MVAQDARLKEMLDESGLDIKSVLNFKALSTFNAALARRESRRCNIFWAGASLAAGFGVTDYNLIPSQRLAALLRDMYPTTGNPSGRGFVPIPTAGVTLPSPWTVSGGSQDPPAPQGSAEVFGLGPNRNIWYTNGSGSISYVAGPRSTAVDVILGKGTAGSADAGRYTINGGGATTFSTLNAGGNLLTLLRIVLPPNATLTIDRNPGGAAGYVIICGLIAYAGDESKGVQVHNLGIPGYGAAQWHASETVAGGWRDGWVLLDPDLVIISDMGGNDGRSSGQNKSAATFKTDYQAWLTKIRAGGGSLPTVPVVLVSPYDTTAGGAFNQAWANYVKSTRDIVKADAANAGFTDLGYRMPPTSGNPKGLYNADLVHGASDGSTYELMAQTVCDVIIPRAPARKNKNPHNSTSSTGYTLTMADADTVLETTSGSATNVTVPPNSSVPYPVGTQIEVTQYGAGQVTFVQGSGVTIRVRGAAMKIAGQYGVAYLRKKDTDEWVLTGDLTT